MLNNVRAAIIFVAMIFFMQVSVASEIIPPTSIAISANKNSYYVRLLDLALSKTVAEYGAYELQFKPDKPVDNRLLKDLESGFVDVTWWPYDVEIQYQVKPVPIRLLKHLSDYRVLLIRKDEQSRFDQVNDLQGLQKLRGGVGSHWPDKKIMERNGLPVVAHVSYFNLFKMLSAKRFDYYSRGVYQISNEVNAYPKLGLVLENELLLHYQNPVYFYVASRNTVLSERIEKGLNLAFKDGSFEQLFQEIEIFRWAEKFMLEQQRRVIELRVE